MNQKHYKMKFYITLFLLILTFNIYSQEVKKDGKIYEVKKDRIYLDGKDITETLNIEESRAIFKQAEGISKDLKIRKKTQKQAEKAEKQAKKAEKAQKKAEKAQKQDEKSLK